MKLWSYASQGCIQSIHVGANVFAVGSSIVIWAGRQQAIVASVSVIEIHKAYTLPVLREEL